MADVCRLGAHVIKLKDMPEGVLVLFGLSHVWKSRVCDSVLQGADRNGMGWEDPYHDIMPTLQRLPFYCIPPAAADTVIPNPTPVDLAMGTRVGDLLLPLLKVLTPEGKGIMADDAAALDVSGNAIHADFFPFFAGPYYDTYPEGGIAGNYEFTCEQWDAPYRPTFGVLTKEVFKDPTICKNMVDEFPIPREMVRVKSLSDDQLTAKMSVLHCMIMSHDGELLACYRGLNQSHHEYVLSANSRLKGYEEKSKAKGKERKKKIKSLTKSLDNLHAKGELLSLAASAGFERGLSMHQTKDEFATISEHATKPLSVILQLKPKKLARPANIPTSRDACVSPPTTKESTITPASKSLELSTNVAHAPFVITLEQNKEWVNAMVDGPDDEMTDGAAHSKSGGSEHVSSGLTDVVVALSASKKGDGSLPSSAVDEEATYNPSGV
ncbi:hypothetical protein Tco_1362619 [Tanacetum coccineum]